MEHVPPDRSAGKLPLVITLTALVLVVPCFAAIGLRASGLVTSPVLLVIIPVIFSILVSHSISEFWKRRRAGSPLLFEDLMLWGWLRRRRFERLLARSEEFVGGEATGLSPSRRAKELERLAGALEARDPRTHGHSKRVARHATSIARKLGLPGQEVARIRAAALLHDIGKIEVPREILEKPAALTDDEFAEIKKHPAAGAHLVESMGDPELATIIRHHHERIDGGGYPDGLSRGQIPIGARIIAVTDTFDALTSARSYRQPSSHEEAFEVLREEAGAQLDARVVRVFDGRYSSRRPIALVAALLGLGRQAGQSMISFGTGASQVAAVGVAAAVIAAPAIEKKPRQDPPRKPAVVREAEAAGPAAPGAAGVDVGGSLSRVGSNPGVKTGRKVGKKLAETRNGRNNGSFDGVVAIPDGGDGGGSARDVEGTGGGPTGAGESDGTGGAGGGTGGGGNSSGSGPAPNPVKKLTETIQKPVREITDPVLEAVPTLPGNDPVSKTVNETVGGVKGLVGKLTGKP